MKQDKTEMAAVEAAAREGENPVADLFGLELALVGGGIGDVVFT
jgi:hypothetical protein